ncbi:MAG TPA: ABC transporter ATP-binding protein [Propionibacteriaceae bacterium]|nr:ABC transporter ATP-binding protein [Propionibacteriaceae bacterium]
MADAAVEAWGLGKDYRVFRNRGYETLRDRLAQAAALPLRAVGRNTPRPSTDVLHALVDLSFSIGQGEAVGFIGHNGAGKSTLLKILSRITEPTRGSAVVRGRVGSLLEVGTGFHPELTGRENIYLNGAVLGMTRKEIVRRFDEIVAFADVERFLDTPVKRYSSGMYVRLAFSVATHLEPEVLVIDEVLAVGDAAFQRRSLARMTQVAREGRTVLFVSHNMAIIQALCSRVVVLDRGRVIADGAPDNAIGVYLKTLERVNTTDLLDRTDRSGRGAILVKTAEVTGGLSGVIRSGEPLSIIVEPTGVLRDSTCALHFHNALGQPVATLDSSAPSKRDEQEEDASRAVFRCDVSELLLVPGAYRVDITLTGDGYRQDVLPGAVMFDVEQGMVGERAVTPGGVGDVAMPHRWRVPATSSSAGEPVDG